MQQGVLQLPATQHCRMGDPYLHPQHPLNKPNPATPTPTAPLLPSPPPPRFMALVLHSAAEQLQLRIIAPDRPGIGLSTALPSRTVQQYPADLAELCDQLGGSGGC
jgi:pimeloyl-ACP methyl ester carboxylesterase